MKTLRPAALGLARGAGAQCCPLLPSLQHRLQALSMAPRTVADRAQSTFSSAPSSTDAGYLSSAMQAATTMVHARPMPVSPAYFSRMSQFNDDYVRISDYYRRLQHLPLDPNPAENVTWKKLVDYKAACGENVRASDYAACIKMVKALHKIHRRLKSEGLRQALVPFMRDITPHRNEPRPAHIDRFGRSVGVGRRKEATARVYLVEGTGDVLVNGKPISEVFGRVHDRESVIWPLRATERMDKYSIWAHVSGGGTTGQAEALTLGVSKALMAHEPALKPVLRRAGCVTRDPRMVERKKPGHVKARKMPAWVKR
ncbi:40S ribosomal protein S9 [Gaeumannomyces tritici R3-111a-1]|uniref:Small ribosomal subunit protein uS9m n=1 Tax=Gaeumannomyces tritici (strain R3-111a-1) TaxID=644352 RepID=J3NY04_GAET3|nr:40S ribosomal protein S9 [Gaeumannomyces tritici R3-111a-1]EJT76237.1 40S ribosomal protein S9 [Gaeumannomyces tritici R3-111a-1]